MPKAPAPAPAKPATATPKLGLKKPAAPVAPAFTPAIGDVIVFNEYEKAPKDPLLLNGDFVKITEIDATKKGRVRYHGVPITGDENGNERPAETFYIEEITAPTAEQTEEINTLLAQAAPDETPEATGEESEDIAALGETANAEGTPEAEAAQVRLTELCTENGLNSEDYADWPAVAAALAPEDIEALGVKADAEDAEAQARLTELAGENSVDVTAFENWAEVAGAIEEAINGGAEEEIAEEQAPAPVAAKPGAKAKPANAKKATTTPKAPKLSLTPTMEAVMKECGNDLLAAMQMTERKQGQNQLDLGGLIALGELQNAHQADIDPATGKPRYEATKKGYYLWVAANLETEERVARHLSKIYRVFVGKLKFEPEGLLGLGISRLREIAPIAIKLAKEDKAANAALKAAGKAEDSSHLESFLQEAATLTVKDTVAKVRGYKAATSAHPAGTPGGVPKTKIATLTFHVFEDKAAFMKTCLDAAMTDLPDAEKNADNAIMRIFAEYAAGAGIPAYVAPVVAKVKAPVALKKTAAPAKAAPAKPGAKTPVKKAVAAK